MDFLSLEFLLFFIIVLLGIRILWKIKYQHLFLLLASYYFYYLTSNNCILILAIITLILFYCGNNIYYTNNHKHKKIYLIFSLISSLGILGFFKYYNFGIETLNNLASFSNLTFSIHSLEIILPIGISFYTFTGLSYVFDIYLGKIEPADRLYKFALLMAYFPHLLSGPIVRASQFLPQLKNRLELTPDNIKFGITLTFWGLIKKIIIADNIAPLVNAGFTNPLQVHETSFNIIFFTFLFGIQIYCDFSGYIDIALGVASIIGLKLPVNFIRPYFSKSPQEFWRRWNITLSSFIRDYIYIPLGGNRKGKARTYINTIIAMLLCGLWHGAAWNFIIWGVYHGILLSFQKIIKNCHIGEKNKFLCQSMNGDIIKIIITQYFIFLGWLIFRVGNLSNLIYCIEKFIWIDWIFTPAQKIGIVVFGLFLTVSFILIQKKQIMTWVMNVVTKDWIVYFADLPLKYWLCYLIGVMLVLLIFAPSSNPTFIYYQF